MKLGELRENYTQSGLRLGEIKRDPLEQFEQWMVEAQEAGIVEPNAMTLATCSGEGVVSSRTVLLKGLHEGTFQFFTNYQSKKARDLSENPHASLTFLWKELERQVNIRGVVEKTDREISKEYFHSRPYGSQIGAWVSEWQSAEVANRNHLIEREKEFREKYPETSEVPLPDFWGGYQLKPDYLEFWQGRPSRLHDRICFQLENHQWVPSRLSP
ncbi:pyridoxamine 5'-phosphate oxidase [Akkermansiaceae bacterium]|nr:pyridoxamine 5'-phosphate oxidase [Akkermansiaceae bacterium]MDB4536991.1 pyridoxamine 5'-phosphate oxidase [Akkermansiaceae bacterium]